MRFNSLGIGVRDPFQYIEAEPAFDAPYEDNPSGLYCPACRSTGVSHCSDPEYCGGMRKMKKIPVGGLDYVEEKV